jgi:carbonic anhydrase
MGHTCSALIVTCMDFRFQKQIFEFLQGLGLTGQYDLYSSAGSQKNFLDYATRENALKQVELSSKLHGISSVYLFAHWDCGGYGGSKAFSSDQEQKQRYQDDLNQAKALIKEKFPLLNVHTYLAHLDEKGEVSFEEL